MRQTSHAQEPEVSTLDDSDTSVAEVRRFIADDGARRRLIPSAVSDTAASLEAIMVANCRHTIHDSFLHAGESPEYLPLLS